MLQDAIQRASEELPIEDICSPIAAQILDFCDDDDSASGDLFGPSDHQQQHQLLLHSSSDVSSSSPTTTAAANTAETAPGASPVCCYADDDVASFSPLSSFDAAAISALLDAPPPLPPPDPESDLIQAVQYACSSSADTCLSNPTPQAPMYPIPPSFQDPFDHMMLADAITGGYAPYATTDQVVPMPVTMVGGTSSHQHHLHQQQQMVAAGYKEDPLYAAALVQQVPGYVGLEATTPQPAGGSYAFYEAGGCGGIGGLYHNGGGMGETQGFYGGGMMMAGQESGFMGAPADVVEYQRMDNVGMGMYGQDSMQRAYSPGDLQQVIGGGNQHLITGCSSSSGTVPATDVSTMDESTFKVGRLSVEERKEKIHRYMKKRNERNFSKKIKYACRKTLADSRPRVRGRFAKNDEFGETTRTTSSNHEFDDEEEVAIKEEDDILNSSDILAHISGVNSFKYNYTLESWI